MAQALNMVFGGIELTSKCRCKHTEVHKGLALSQQQHNYALNLKVLVNTPKRSNLPNI